jgi:uncharacterized repeat protein (TIGR03806 family)
MRFCRFDFFLTLIVLLPGLSQSSHAQDDRGTGFDTTHRVPWTTSRIKGSPEPPAPYRTVNAFPRLKFNEPLDMTSAPGTERLFVVERFGRILSFPNDSSASSGETLLERDGVSFYGLAFHPQFQTNGWFYVTITVGPDGDPRGTRVSRFHVGRDNPLHADPGSERIILEWPAGGHNGGCLKFGPDGYLYVATGDSSGIADEKRNGQNLSTLSGAILRIDVNTPDDGPPYAVPGDNPFVDTGGARPEIWAYGLRQPWKMSIDRETGDFWAGNVGQDLWEQIFLIERGGNYGWSVMEGSHPFGPDRERGPTPFIPPVVEHDHAEFRSITGGFVYHGARLPELRGAYIYGDYDTGKIWMFRYDREARKVTEHRELVDSALRLVGFGEDHAGELYLVDHMGGVIDRLERNPAADTTADFPRRLSETGLFASTADQQPAPGVIPYDVNAPQWLDGASAERWLAIPGDATIEFDGITYPQPAPGAPHGWKFPDGTVAVETILMETQPGRPESRRRLETRILHYEHLAGGEEVGDQFWRGYSYLWNEDQTDAVLLEDPLGTDLTLPIAGPAAEGGTRTQTWHVPGRAECMVCHNMAAKYVLGVNTLQLNRDFDYGSVAANQLDVFQRLGLFGGSLSESADRLPRVVDYRDESLDTAERARGYLHANCSHCHRKWGGGNAEFLLLSTVSLKDMGIADVPPGHGGFYIPDARILAPGAPQRSVLYYRMAKLGPGRMPRIGSSEVDEAGLGLIRDWIAGLGSTPDQTGDFIASLNGASSADARQQRIGELLANTQSALLLLEAVDEHAFNAEVRDQIIELATASSEAHVRDLFERFLPEEKRTQRLGNVIRPEAILALEGDAERGRSLFFEAAGVQCRNCHKIGETGRDVGPDLSEVGKKYTERGHLLDTILNPSREIDPRYRVHLAQTTDGRVFTGLLVEQTDTLITLKDAENKVTQLAAADVEQLVPQQTSLMPDLLLRDMTGQQVADLLEFLGGLR